MKDSTQLDILLHLQEHGRITPWDAWWEYGCYRLSVVISRFRKDYVITTEMTEGKNKKGKTTRYATYFYWGAKDDPEKVSQTP